MFFLWWSSDDHFVVKRTWRCQDGMVFYKLGPYRDVSRVITQDLIFLSRTGVSIWFSLVWTREMPTVFYKLGPYRGVSRVEQNETTNQTSLVLVLVLSPWRRRTMCGLSQKYSGDVNQTKPNLISQMSNLVQFGLTSPEYFCDNPHIVRHLTRDINHTIPASPEGFNPNFLSWFWSLGRRRTMCGLSQKYLGDVKSN